LAAIADRRAVEVCLLGSDGTRSISSDTGALPLCAGHWGMAEVTAALAAALPAELRTRLSFDVGPGAVALAQHAACRYSWESVAQG